MFTAHLHAIQVISECPALQGHSRDIDNALGKALSENNCPGAHPSSCRYLTVWSVDSQKWLTVCLILFTFQVVSEKQVVSIKTSKKDLGRKVMTGTHCFGACYHS